MPQPLTLPAFCEQDFQAPRSHTVGAGVEDLEEIADLERSECLRRICGGTLDSICSWELVAAADSPDTRMTTFLNGCPLCCLHCHNPDTFLMKNGVPVSDTGLLSHIVRYRCILRTTRGNITPSGDKVLMQSQSTEHTLVGAEEMGVHTHINTSRFLDTNCDDGMLGAIDLVSLDIEGGNEETYKKVTRRSLVPTIEFDDRVVAHSDTTHIWIHFMLALGLTDNLKNVRQVGEIISRWRNVIGRIGVLSSHQLGKDEWRSLGLKCQPEDTRVSTPKAVEEARNYFRSPGFLVY